MLLEDVISFVLLFIVLKHISSLSKNISLAIICYLENLAELMFEC
jgi:hypothetical protein